MSSAANTLLSLILIALGFLGITLSFLVPDKKKSTISLILAGVVVLTGFVQMIDQSYSRYRINQRMRDIQRDQQVNFEELRQKMKTQATGASAPAPAPAAPNKK
jgi:peptidoglycan biosynthesis protein MviN/MurJ (putative lipid II flippase)